LNRIGLDIEIIFASEQTVALLCLSLDLARDELRLAIGALLAGIASTEAKDL
jgi:hypothetical protein